VVVDTDHMGLRGDVFGHHLVNTLWPIVHEDGAGAWGHLGIEWFHGLVVHDFVTTGMQGQGRFDGPADSRQNRKGNGYICFEKKFGPFEIEPDVVDDQGDARRVGDGGKIFC